MSENFFAEFAPEKQTQPPIEGNFFAEFAPEKKPQSSIIGDIAKSAGAGLIKGALAIPGAVGDVRALVNLGLDKLMGPIPKVDRSGVGILSPPTTATLQRGLEAITGPLYEPQTRAGKFAGTAAEFVPAALALPAGAASRAASALRIGVVPGVASEAAGQVTEGTALEPWARTGAGILGGLAGGARFGNKTPPPPSSEALKDISRAEYKKAFKTPVNVSLGGMQKLKADVGVAMEEFGYHPKLQKAVAPVLKELDKLSRGKKTSTLKRLDTVRRIARHATTNIDPSTREAAGIFMEKVDDFLENLTPGDVAGNLADASAAAASLKQAQLGWKTARKTEMIEDLIEKAGDTAVSTGSGGNINNALRQQFKNLIHNPKKARHFNKVELDAMREVEKGATLDNFARLIGKLSPEGNGLMLLANFAHAAYNPAAGIPGMAAGMVAKRYADTKTRGRAERALRTVAGGGKAQPPIVTKFGTFPRSEAGLRALAAALAGHAAVADRIPQPVE